MTADGGAPQDPNQGWPPPQQGQGQGQQGPQQGQGWQQSPPPQYPQGPYPGPGSTPAPAPGKGMAVTALVLGIVACVTFWTVVGGLLLGLLALIFGIVGVRRAARGRADGRTMAIIGMVLGVLAMIGAGLVLAVGLVFWNSDTVSTYKDCMENAQTEEARKHCDKEFDREVDKEFGN
ncbi:DUF4190 domain-containing protein [Streptomyces sp. T-3]|nr:DUF4190 domain-containing protein [Streptomyces sp. T-3]